MPAAALANEPFIVREPGSGTRTALQEYLDEYRLKPTFIMEMPSNEAIKQAVMAGMGVSLLSLHTIGLEWLPDQITFYVDGLKVMSRRHAWAYEDGTEGAPAHILLNLAIGGQWAGRFGIDDAAFPQSLDIDWVRAYQQLSPSPGLAPLK